MNLIMFLYNSDALKTVAAKESQHYSLDDKDLLSLLRGLSQGDGVVERWYKHEINHEKHLSAVLLRASFDYCSEYATGKYGVMKSVDFFTNYWALAYRLRGNLTPDSNFPITLEGIKRSEGDIEKAHAKLSMFLKDNKKNFLEVK